jgi:membrane protein DedA with SNARE-associated domain
MNWWEYLALFLAVAASWAGVPMIGSAALGAAAVGASQGNLNLVAVLIIAAVAGEIGGLLGYRVGDRWGRRILGRPGKRQASRQRMMDKGERAYAKWGRLAVFFTPAIISGTARMKWSQFVVWNFVASGSFALAVGPTAYGAGRVSTGHHSTEDVSIFVLGLVMSVILIALVVHRYRRHRATIGGAAG